MVRSNEFSLRVDDDDRGLIVHVSGELDVVTSPRLYECLKGLDPGRVVTVNMSKVTFLDSSGLSVLIVAFKARQAAGGDLVLFGVKRSQKKLFEVTNLDQVFKFDGE